MSRVSEILVRCRDSLADEDESRWSEDRLLRLIDEAQKKIATKAQLLRRVTTVSIIAGTNTYKLPSDAFLLTRVVSSDGAKIGIKSHSDMDDLKAVTHEPTMYDSQISINNMWENDVGSNVEYLIFDNQEPGTFKIYPIVESVQDADNFVVDEFGTITSVEDDLVNSTFGVTTNFTSNALNTTQFNSVFGVVTELQEISQVLKIYYRAKPEPIKSAVSLLSIDSKWDEAIKHYVVGMALHDDQDTRNRAASSDELNMYSIEFQESKKLSAKDFTNRSNSRTNYNTEI